MNGWRVATCTLVSLVLLDQISACSRPADRDPKGMQTVELPAPDNSHDVLRRTLDADVAAILDRPLFMPSRRMSVSAKQRAKLPRLTGVVVSPTGDYALFEAAPSRRATVVTNAARIGKWTVVNISPNSATLTDGGETAVARLTAVTAVKQSTTALDIGSWHKGLRRGVPVPTFLGRRQGR